MNVIKKISKMIPKSIKNYIKNEKTIQNFYKYKNLCEKNNLCKYILINTPNHGNIGDQAIELSEEMLLKDNDINFFEIICNKVEYVIEKIKKDINKNDIILIHGGGYLGNQWINEELRVRKIIETFPDSKIIIFPQTIFYKEDEESQKQLEISKKIFSEHKNLHIFAREKKSYETMKEVYSNNNIYLVPDIVLYNNDECEQYDRQGITFVIRNDPEKKVSNEEMLNLIQEAKKITSKVYITDTHIQKNIKNNKRKKVLNNKLEEFKKSRLVITDRLHGMIFAKITRTPCIVLSNYNHKVQGVYEWLKDLPYIYYANNIEEAKNNIKDMYENGINKYKEISFKEKFNILINEIKNI